MEKDIIIIGFNKPTSEGISLILNKETSLKGMEGIKGKEFWVSWDRIGEVLFDNYTDSESVEDRDKLRKK